MKSRFFVLLIVLFIVLSMALCACNGTSEGNPTTTDNNTSQSAGDLETLPNSTDVQVEPTDKGLFITEPEEFDFTLPSDIPSVELPEVELGDDDEGILTSRPVNETVPEAETTAATTAPSSGNAGSDVLPEHVLDED